jgi:hypothetical protein
LHVTSNEEYGSRVFESKVLWRIFGHKRIRLQDARIKFYSEKYMIYRARNRGGKRKVSPNEELKLN